MLSSYNFLFRLLIFWFGFFAAFRLWFIFQSAKSWSTEQPYRIFLSLFRAIPLDISFASYLIAIPFLITGISIFMSERGILVLRKTIYYLYWVLIPAIILIFGANIFLYEEWNTMLNHRAIQYMKTPAGLLDSMAWYFILLCIALFFLVSWATLQVFRRWVMPVFPSPSAHKVRDFALFLLAIPLLALGIRGGLGNMPISESKVYYSTHLIENHAATNTGWHFMHSMIETAPTENNYLFMSSDSAQALVKPLFLAQAKEDSLYFSLKSTPDTSTTQDPNIVLIIMESMTAQLFASLGGEQGICPNMENIAQSGISFTNVYGSGFRTDQGLVSIFSGYPALPDQSIILLEDKMRTLPSLPKTMEARGYQTGFYYGGELTFANMGQYIYHLGFDKIKSISDYPSSTRTQKWGVDDKLFLSDLLEACNTYRSPFFVAALTLSLHTPFDLPQVSPYNSGSIPDKFRNAAAFTDQAIGEFLQKAAKQPWYENTIFVFVADHGHGLPGQISIDDPRSRHVPLILYGNPIKRAVNGIEISTFGGHHDLPATFLSLIGAPHAPQDFPYSRNLFTRPSTKEDSLHHFGYYCNENGMGWATTQGITFYDFVQKKWQIMQGQPTAAEQNRAKAFLQTHYQNFIER